ncbi:BCD family MFS transporter [Elioraea tepida]|uniref:BCD family MFS transporter n=1 Tax=Elioraea tepida TaxID=2843330 RepID=A0A975U518_9PROT|nr:BCD family MFS transporter [Elioraea tepida]QXM25191.1 BCD family MFS transporter [Elioraea tepida]
MGGGGGTPGLGWFGILRLGLVQTALGAIVVLTTSAINRVMVVELALPATLPGVLVAVHYAVQMLRPRMGYGSDIGGRRTPWIIGGMAVLAAGGVLAACATALMEHAEAAGLALSLLAFLLIGLGVGAAGTSLLVLLAAVVAERRRPAAASLVWIMMIAGFVLTTAITGRLLDPYSGVRLITVSAGVSCVALALALVAVWGIERRHALPAAARAAVAEEGPRTPFRQALAEVWAERDARRFTVFVFLSMLAYSAQDLILEPFAGQVFGMTLGETTRLASLQHGGVLAGMIVIALVGSFASGTRLGSMRAWTVGGCLAAAVAVLMLTVAGRVGEGYPLRLSYFLLGLANGVFAAAAIASMMQMVSRGRERREGIRMGLWGAAQAIAFGTGSLAGAVALDAARAVFSHPVAAYSAVFVGDALLFIAAAWLALGIGASPKARASGHAAFPPARSAVGG